MPLYWKSQTFSKAFSLKQSWNGGQIPRVMCLDLKAELCVDMNMRCACVFACVWRWGWGGTGGWLLSLLWYSLLVSMVPVATHACFSESHWDCLFHPQPGRQPRSYRHLFIFWCV